MLPGHTHRVIVALLNICRWGVGCHAQMGLECESYDPWDRSQTMYPIDLSLPVGIVQELKNAGMFLEIRSIVTVSSKIYVSNGYFCSILKTTIHSIEYCCILFHNFRSIQEDLNVVSEHLRKLCYA